MDVNRNARRQRREQEREKEREEQNSKLCGSDRVAQWSYSES